MDTHLFRFLSALLLLILLCSAVQATRLQVTVQDSVDNTTIPQATVYLDNVNMGRTTVVGTFFLVHDGLDDKILRITKNG
jgi:hypothetical protein